MICLFVRQAYVAEPDPAASIQEHPRGHHQEDRAQGLPLGAILRPAAAGNRHIRIQLVLYRCIESGRSVGKGKP